MPLDIAPSRQQTTTAELHYLKRTAERPARYVMEPPPGVPGWNGIDDPHLMRIEDARGREAEFTLDRNGFALVKAPSAVHDFYDPDQIKSVYYPEVERLLRDTLGASRVVVFDHNVRNGGRSDLPQPSRRVHNDHTVNSAPRRVRDHLGAEAEVLLQGRFGIVNVWRPIRGPVLDSPLALCDARGFTGRPDRERSRLSACSRGNVFGRIQARASLVLLLEHDARRSAADPHPRQRQ